MAEIATTQADQARPIGVNKTCDLGTLLLEDCQSYEGKNEKDILQETKKNVCMLFKELFDLKRQQKIKEGEDGEVLEYTKPIFNVELPEPKVVLPREKHIPKPKPLTKWEKFR